jgi:NADPH-dependent curcumin reductase CurA
MLAREIHLASRPLGWPTEDNFRLVEVAVPDPGPGELLVRNSVMSVDPYMRGRMNDFPSYVPPFVVDRPLEGGAVGEVLVSGSADVKPGDVVRHSLGWRDYAVVPARDARVVDTAIAPASAYLGVLGMPGLTAYAGLVEVAALRPGDVVFVSAAAGAVGSLAGQIARLRGAARVVGSAGSAAKVAWVRELGFDAAFDYHDGPVRRSLKAAAPEGIDVYFDNVGGDHLDVAIAALRPHGRVAMCGAIAAYNASQPMTAPRNLVMAIGKRLTLRGFIVGDFERLRPAFLTEMGAWLQSGQVTYRETFVDGLANAPAAFLGLLRGDNVGKMLVQL